MDNPEAWRRLIEQFDYDKNQVLDFHEFTALCESLKQEFAPECTVSASSIARHPAFGKTESNSCTVQQLMAAAKAGAFGGLEGALRAALGALDGRSVGHTSPSPGCETFDFRLQLQDGIPVQLHAPPYAAIARLETIVDPNGLSNVGARLHAEMLKAGQPRRIATMVAGNSGRPAGACGFEDGTIRKLHAGHTTQEEDVVSNWMATACHNAGRPLTAGTADGGHAGANAVYQATIFGKWGMLHPQASDKFTVQRVRVLAHAPQRAYPAFLAGRRRRCCRRCRCCRRRRRCCCCCYLRALDASPFAHVRTRLMNPRRSRLCQVDYTRARHPSFYGHAWVVGDAALSDKRTDRYGQRFYDVDVHYPTSLVFVAGPNCGSRGRDARSTMTRTFNPHAEADYALFRSGVRAALYAGLMAMARLGSEVALLAHVSAGIYAGPHRARLRADFEAIVNELLEHAKCDSPSGPAPLGRYFHRVILTLLE